MKKFISKVMVVIMSVTLVSCGGYFKEVNHASMPNRYEADKKTCEQLEFELHRKRYEVQKSKDKIKFRNVCNVVFGVTGVLLFFPFLFVIDPTTKDNANYQNRVYEYNYLLDLAEDKQCPTGGQYQMDPNIGYWGM